MTEIIEELEDDDDVFEPNWRDVYPDWEVTAARIDGRVQLALMLTRGAVGRPLFVPLGTDGDTCLDMYCDEKGALDEYADILELCTDEE